MPLVPAPSVEKTVLSPSNSRGSLVTGRLTTDTGFVSGLSMLHGRPVCLKPVRTPRVRLLQLRRRFEIGAGEGPPAVLQRLLSEVPRKSVQTSGWMTLFSRSAALGSW